MKLANPFLSLTLCIVFLPSQYSVAWARPNPSARSRSAQSPDELPKVIFLNQSAVLIASKKHREEYREHQARLIDMLNKGVTVLVCPDCMKQYGVKAADLIDGVQIGKPGQAHES